MRFLVSSGEFLRYVLAPKQVKQTLIRKSVEQIPLLIQTATGGKKKAITNNAMSRPV
jgi:hypothetical protein